MFKRNFEPNKKERSIAEKHLDRIVSLTVKKHSKLLIVGENACGKSLLRQILKVAKLDKADKFLRFHSSMQLRTANNASMGALSSMMHDLPWLATSHTTLTHLEKVLGTADEAIEKDQLFSLCIDEPEIGLGFGAQRGLAKWMYSELNTRAKKALYTMVITHSPIFVQNAPEDWEFIDLSLNPTKSIPEWLEKQFNGNYIIDPGQLIHYADTMFVTVRDRINKNKKDKK